MLKRTGEEQPRATVVGVIDRHAYLLGQGLRICTLSRYASLKSPENFSARKYFRNDFQVHFSGLKTSVRVPKCRPIFLGPFWVRKVLGPLCIDCVSKIRQIFRYKAAFRNTEKKIGTVLHLMFS